MDELGGSCPPGLGFVFQGRCQCSGIPLRCSSIRIQYRVSARRTLPLPDVTQGPRGGSRNGKRPSYGWAGKYSGSTRSVRRRSNACRRNRGPAILWICAIRPPSCCTPWCPMTGNRCCRWTRKYCNNGGNGLTLAGLLSVLSRDLNHAVTNEL